MESTVIDLISSSPPPSSLPTDDVPSGTTSINHAPTSGRHARNLDSHSIPTEASTLVDLTEPFEADDSPRNSSVTRDLWRGDPTSIRSPANCLDPTAGSKDDRPPSLDIDFQSDDFDDTGDLDAPILAQITGNKRRRLSPPTRNIPKQYFPLSSQSIAPDTPVAEIVPSASTTRQPKITHAVANASPDPFASSPVLDSAYARKAQPSAARESSTNPFASSPMPNPKPSEQSRHLIARESSPNPFATSPLPASRPAETPQHNVARQRPSHPSDHPRSSYTQPTVTQTPGLPVTGIDISSSAEAPIFPTSNRRHAGWDPISSSAPEASNTHNEHTRALSRHHSMTIEIDSDSPCTSGDELPDIDNFKPSTFQRMAKSPVKQPRQKKYSRKDRSGTLQPAKSKDERAREREHKAAAKEAEKEQRRRDREQQKEEKLKEKQRSAALAEVNKLRTDKKVSTPEMIVDMAATLNDTVQLQAKTVLEGLEVEHSVWDSPVDSAIRWRRKVRSRFNDDLGYWEPIAMRVKDERHIAVVLAANDFVAMVQAGELDDHVSKLHQHFPQHHIIYILEGLAAWIRRNRNTRNRQFASGVRSQEAAPGPPARSRQNGATAEYISEDIVEDGLLQLQVMHEVFIHQTATPLETAQWIAVLTQHISTIPYKKQKDMATLGAAFCMETGQVRTGDDAKDTYVRLLQEIARVTAPIAYGIAADFTTVPGLIKGLEDGGPNTLEAIKKSANRDGAVTDRTIGQAVSRRIHKVFTGRDESSTDV